MQNFITILTFYICLSSRGNLFAIFQTLGPVDTFHFQTYGRILQMGYRFYDISKTNHPILCVDYLLKFLCYRQTLQGANPFCVLFDPETKVFGLLL